ncbi:hypothetical protein [Bdellovibrio svalbardensis]|uniref:Uncharacterized protein n=1 Tax=Bdellovibrio svalbardensis TaxID=2972972 RepID=A0ABT6DFM9_9BACT|nr:hypothetical protein [Bdellovibrio svalbardensis]MDG0815654.1 hypothetical protein [Bdellovibrio svalbardensis]
MKKIIMLVSLLCGFNAMAKSEPFIAVSSNQAITILTKKTKVPANVLFAPILCYNGTVEDAEEIIQRSIEIRGGYTLVGFRTGQYLGDLSIFAEIETDRQATVKIRLDVCGK